MTEKPLELPEKPQLFSDNAEKVVLCQVLNYPDCFEKYSFLKAEDFYYPLHQRIYRKALELYQDNKPLSILTLTPIIAQETAGMTHDEIKKYVAAVQTSFQFTGTIYGNAQDVAEYARRREIFEFIEKTKSEILTQNHIQQAASMIDFSDKILANDNQAGFQTGFEVCSVIEGDLKKDRRPVSTGFESLNQCTDGGFYFGKSYAFAARKKVGKTLLASTLAYNLAIQDVKTLFIACEMNPEEIHQRILSRTGGFYPSSFLNSYSQSADFQQKFTKSIQWKQENILYKKAASITFEKLKMYVNIAIKKDKCKAIILDYWQLIGCNDNKKSKAEHLDEVAQWLADTGRKFNVIIICMAQINQTGNTRGGEGIKLAFDQVYQIHREDLTSGEAWVEMTDTRYTKWMSIGSPECAGWRIGEFGTYFEEM